MIILSPEKIRYDSNFLNQIKKKAADTLRLIAYSRAHFADDLLNAYLSKITDYKTLLSIKNAQLEAQSEQEAKQYEVYLKNTVDFVTEELKNQVNFTSQVQLFQLFRLISPDAHSRHPNGFRKSDVQIGGFLCPEPKIINSLVSQVFENIKLIEEPIIKAIYLHHELIRIHPFVDGNGRTIRVAKNWMLMHEMNAPIFISDSKERKLYVKTLENSFLELKKHPGKWNQHLDGFFNQELQRLMHNNSKVFKHVHNVGESRGF